MNDIANPPTLPQVKGGCIGYLSLEGAAAAAEFYKRAFGATVAFAYPPDEQGRTMHIHLYVNGSSLMLGDFFPEHGHVKVKPQGFSMMLAVDDIDFWFKRAVDAGCEVTTPVDTMFWGDRYGALRDPFGVAWAMNQSRAQ